MNEFNKDSFLIWLKFANAGMLHPGNIESMEFAVKSIPENTSIIEIGSFCGLSTNVIGFFKEVYKKKNALFCTDRWDFEGAEKKDSLIGSSSYVTHRQYKEFVKNTFEQNVRMFSQYDLPYPIEMYSDDFFMNWSNKNNVHDIFKRDVKLGGEAGFCYIDGNHTYDYAHRDFVNSDKHLVIGGFILFDDSGDDSQWEVKKVISEVKDTGRYRIIANNPNYLFQKMFD